MTDPREQAALIKKHWVRLTRTCNNRCLFCLDSEAQNGAHIPLEHIFADLRKGRKSGAKRAILSGGEPTLHPSLIDIITTARKIGYDHIQIITNGRMFAYKDFLTNCLASGLSEVTFSIHGHSEKLHDRQTGVPGSYHQTMQALKNALNEKNLIVSVDIVVNRLNIPHLRAIIDHLAEIGVREFDLLHIIPFGQAWNNKKILFYNMEKALPYLRKAFHLSLDPNLHIWTSRFPPSALEGFEHLMQHPNKFYEEVKARKHIFEQFLNKGKKIYCQGTRCRFCFLENFCQDLITSKQDGKLATIDPPFCSKIGLKQNKYLFNSKKMNLSYHYLNFFIKNRFTIKSLGCRSCSFNKECNGFLYETIRKEGFKLFGPIPQREKIGYYLNKFALTPKMKMISAIILNNQKLTSSYVGIKLSSKYLKNICSVEILEKAGCAQETGLFKDAMAIGKLILSEKNHTYLKNLRPLIKDTKPRIGYSIRDGRLPSLKIYLIFDKGLTNNLKKFDHLFNRSNLNIIKKGLRNSNNILSLGFKSDHMTISFYKAGAKLSSPVPELGICKRAYYYTAYTIFKNKRVIPKKIYKIYKDERDDLINSEIRQYFKNTSVYKIICEDFKHCKIDGVGLRLKDLTKDVYLKI